MQPIIGNEFGKVGKITGAIDYILEKARAVDKKQLFALLLLFLLAFGVRAYLMKYELMFEFDTYWHARMVSYVIQDGYVPDRDPMAYYQIGGSTIGSPCPVFWYLSAFIYKVFTLGAQYDQKTLFIFVMALPAIFGALISVSMFFLLKEMYGKKAGYVAAFLAALVPAFVYRTMAGFFEDDSLGFLWMILGLYFFVKAIKEPKLDKEHIKSALISAALFGIMSWSWGMFLLVPLILLAYAFWALVLMWFRSENKGAIKAFVALFAIVFVLMSFIASTEADGTEWMNSILGYVTQYAPVTPDNIARAGDRGPGVLQQTIGEENMGQQFWGTKYNALIVFPFIALALVPYRLFRNRKDNISLIIFFWAALTIFMAWNKLKFTYTLGLPIAACAGLVYSEVFYFMKGRETFENKIVGVALAFMLLLGIGAGSFFMTQQFPNIHLDNGWLPAINWARENLPAGSKVFNWWDEGHWISMLAGMKVSCDNRNFNFKADQDFARFVISEDANEAYHMVKDEYGADYVMFGIDMLMKPGAMAIYAYNTVDGSDPRLARYFGVVIPCSVEASPDGTIHHCGGNTMTHEQMMSVPDKWSPEPNDFENERVPLFIYRTTEATHLIALNAPANNMLAAKLWFSEPSVMELFEPVFLHPQVKIFKVK